MSNFDLVWDTRSGDSFSDMYGSRRHRTMSLVHEFAAQTGATLVLAPQTIGTFATREARLLARRSLNRSRAVFARDPESAREANDLGRPVDAITSDLVFAIDQPARGTERDVLINVSGLLWSDNPHVDARAYRETVIELVQRLRSGGRGVALLAHVRDSSDSDNDVPAVLDAARMIGGEIDMIVPEGLDDVRSQIAGSRLVIAARMHACLNALSVGVPAIPMAYSRKFLPLMDAIGWSHSVDLRTDVNVSAQISHLAGNQDALDAEASLARSEGVRGVDTVVSVLAGVR